MTGQFTFHSFFIPQVQVESSYSRGPQDQKQLKKPSLYLQKITTAHTNSLINDKEYIEITGEK